MSEKAIKSKFDYSLLRRVLTLAIPYRMEFYTTVVLSFVLAALALLQPYLCRWR